MLRFTTSVCTSIYWWKAILRFNLVSIILHRDLQKLLKKWPSQYETIECNPKFFPTYWKNNRAASSPVTVFFQGIGRTILLN